MPIQPTSYKWETREDNVYRQPLRSLFVALSLSLILVAKHLLAEPNEGLLVHFVWDAAGIHLVKFKLVVCHSAKCLLAACPIDKAITLQIEQREDVADFLLRKDACLETLLLF